MENYKKITACILAVAVIAGTGISFASFREENTSAEHIEYVSERQGASVRESSDNVPVDISARYILDGKEYDDIDDIKGKSGHLTVEFSYENREYVRKKINGRSTRIYLPLMVSSVTRLDGNIFTNVKIKNGNGIISSDGDYYTVTGTAFPQFSESLAVDKNKSLNVEIPESFSFEADVENFSIEDTVITVSNREFNNLNLDKFNSAEEIAENLKQISESANTVNGNSKTLFFGMNKLSEGSEKLSEGIGELYDGAYELKDGAEKISDGAGELSDGAGTLSSSAGELAGGINSAKSG